MRKTRYLLLGLLSLSVLSSCGEPQQVSEQPNLPKYAVAQEATPMFHSPELATIFGEQDGKTLKLDEDQQIDELEYVALPGTAFEIKRLDYDKTKEGNQDSGVKIRTLDEVLTETLAFRVPVNKYSGELANKDAKKFVIRRWYNENKKA